MCFPFGEKNGDRVYEEYLLLDAAASNLRGLSDIIMDESLAGKAYCILLHHLQHICLAYALPFPPSWLTVITMPEAIYQKSSEVCVFWT